VVGLADHSAHTASRKGQDDVSFDRSDDIGDLTRLLTKALHLVAADIPDVAKGANDINVILSSLVSITHNLAELSGLYRSVHGWSGDYRGLDPLHTRLAAGAQQPRLWIHFGHTFATGHLERSDRRLAFWSMRLGCT
jgi:hypothetical protein